MEKEGTEFGKRVSHPFRRLQSDLAQLIASSQPGEKLPAEPDLARQLRVSRATLREAMRSFEGQGIIRRRQGVGTFVVGRSPVIETGLEVLESIENLARRNGLEVSMGDLHISLVQADVDEAGALGIPLQSDLVQVRRVILAGNRPVAFLVDTLPGDILTPQDLSQGFTGSVLDLLLGRGTPKLGRSIAEVRSVAASAEIARSLEIQRGDVLLEFIACLYTIEGRVIDYSLSFFLPGVFRFQVVRRVGNPG